MPYVASYTILLSWNVTGLSDVAHICICKILSSIPDLGSGVKKYTYIYKVKCFKDSVYFYALKGIFIRKYSTFVVYINLLKYMPIK